MNKRAKDKLVRSRRENGGGWDAEKDLHSRTGRDEKKGKTQEKMERGSRKRSSSAGSEKDGESWWQIGKNGRTLFDRPKPTVGCSANGRRRRYFFRLLFPTFRFVQRTESFICCIGNNAVCAVAPSSSNIAAGNLASEFGPSAK